MSQTVQAGVQGTSWASGGGGTQRLRGSWAPDCLSRVAGRGVVYVSERGPDALSTAGPWVSSLC